MDNKEGKPVGNLIHIDEARIRDQLGKMVRGAVEGEADKQSHAIARRT